MIFNFIVRHLHFLAKFPLAPQFFDAALLTWTAIFHRERLRAIEVLQEHALTLPNVRLSSHRYGGTAFVHNNYEFAHLHSNGLLDIELTRALASKLISQNRALPHHVLGPSRWISFRLTSPLDVSHASALLEAACQYANKKADHLAGLAEIDC
jgi:hypothetical protein